MGLGCLPSACNRLSWSRTLSLSGGGSLIHTTAEKRRGRPEERGFAIASVADERNGYLAGVDVLVDGGSVIGKKFVK